MTNKKSIIIPCNKKNLLISLSLLVILLFSACKSESNSTVSLTQNPTQEEKTDQPEGPELVNGVLLDGTPDESEKTAPPVMNHSEDYSRSRAINTDVIGWITVPNTRIEYPIVRGEDNVYYLTHSIDGQSTKSGSVFMDYRNQNPLEDKHTIIYGHNMRNKTMFYDLGNYKDKDFFKNNRDITIYVGDQKLNYEVFSAFVVNINTDFIRTHFSTGDEFVKYMNDLRGLSKFEPKPSIALSKDDQVITLVTCTYEYDNSRFAIQARRVS